MERAFRKELQHWRKSVIKYKINSSTSADNLKDILERVRDSGDKNIEKKCENAYSKFYISSIFGFIF